jgi:pyrroloquinoline-quinone synthase
MPASDVAIAVEESVDGFRLLDHPFYRKWQEGLLSRHDLGEYAGQYRCFEEVLPEALDGVAGQLSQGPARDLVTSNLDDERSRPEPHVQLFASFAEAVGAPACSEPTQATGQLVDLYRQAVASGPVAALSVIAAYEVQAAGIAATKAASLHQHYGLGRDAIRFWAVHSEMEESHAAWTTAALDDLGADPAMVSGWSTRSAEAWWAFLDERTEVGAGV